MYGSYQRWLIEGAARSVATNRPPPVPGARQWVMHRLEPGGRWVQEVRVMTAEQRAAAGPEWVTAYSY